MSYFRHHLAVILILVVFHNAAATANDDLYISSGNVIFTENFGRRILVESGVVLKKTGEKLSTRYGDMLPVQTPSGITGLAKLNKIIKLHKTEVQLAVVKKTQEHVVDDNNIIMLIAGRIHPYQAVKNNGDIEYKVESGVFEYDIKKKKFDPDEPIFITIGADDFFSKFNIVKINPDFYKWEFKKDIKGKIAKQKWGCGSSSKLVKFSSIEGTAAAEAEAGFDFLKWIKATFKVTAEASAGVESVVTSEKKDLTYAHQMTFWNLRDLNNKIVFQVVIDKLSYCPNAPERNSKIHFSLKFPGNELDDVTLDHGWNNWVNDFKDPTHPFYIATMDDYYRLHETFDNAGSLKASEGVFKYERNLWDLILRQLVTITKPKK